jgi:prolyl oligopeptidase
MRDRHLSYPPSPRTDTVEPLHGVEVPDPYRWLEEIDSAQTQSWIEAENRLTFDYLSQIPARSRIRQRITELWDYEKCGVPFNRGGRYFLTRNNGLQNQDVLYWMQSLADEPQVLLDPNGLSEDGTIALTGYEVSEDGNLLAYALSASGSDWQAWHVREVETGRDLADDIQWAKFSQAAWTPDGRGFFYDEPLEGAAYKGANFYQKLYYHRIGRAQTSDDLVYERPDEKEWGFGGVTTEDGHYLIIPVWRGTYRENAVFYKDLAAQNAPAVELLCDFDASYEFVGNDGPVFYFATDRAAPMGRLVAIDTRLPDPAHWKEILPESGDALQGASLVGNHIDVQ